MMPAGALLCMDPLRFHCSLQGKWSVGNVMYVARGLYKCSVFRWPSSCLRSCVLPQLHAFAQVYQQRYTCKWNRPRLPSAPIRNLVVLQHNCNGAFSDFTQFADLGKGLQAIYLINNADNSLYLHQFVLVPVVMTFILVANGNHGTSVSFSIPFFKLQYLGFTQF